ncbi:MAG: hypothetical protein Q9197_003081 [Variospora fuerteventurae]
MPSRNITTPISSSGLEISTSLPKTFPTSQAPANRYNSSPASVRERWIGGLTQYTDLHLHAALSTFKRLLRELRSPTDAPNSPTTSVVHGEIPPYRTLLPEEVALLYINIGLIHGYLGSYYLSAAAFEEALLVDDSSAISFFGLGIARFYLRELGASKRAFGRCQQCFDVRAGGMRKYPKDECTYRIWTGQSGPESKPSTIQPADASDPWQQFRDLFSRDFPGGVWTLVKARVEWNCRIVIFERNYVRKGVERPGGGKWGLNGIPAGVIFGPDSVAGGRNAIIRSSIDDSQPAQSVGGTKTVALGPVGSLKSRTGSLVRQKWSLLQHKILRKRNDESNQPLPFTRPKTSSSSSSSRHSKPELTSIEEKIRIEEDAPAQAPHRHPGILKKTMPPLTPYPIDLPDDEELIDSETPSDTSPLRSPPHTPPPDSFPLRRSSLKFHSNSSFVRRRRGSLLAIDSSTHSIQSIEEETPESKFIKYSLHHNIPLNSSTAQETPDSPFQKFHYPNSPTSSNVSPKTLVPPRRHAEDIMLPTLMNDLAPSPSPSASIPFPTLSRLAIPDSAAGSPPYGYDSFMTDNISPLSPHVRSAMFPSISSSRKSSSSRRASHVVGPGTSRAHSVASEVQYDGGNRRPSTIVTLTPATPERGVAGVHPPMVIPLLDDGPVGDDDQQQLSPPFEAYLDDADMAVEPLSFAQKKKNREERMSVTGRACLTEWEWEEAYERWRGDGPEFGGDDNEDTEDMVGEMLLPRRFGECI